MAKLYIVRGLPGSGKSKNAKQWVANDPVNRARVNRDDLRDMMHGGYISKVTEEQVTESQYAMIDTLLDMDKEVILDDTNNLNDERVRALIRIALDHEADWEIVDRTNVPLDLCLLENSSQRRIDSGRVVPEKVIRMMHEEIKDRGYPLPVPEVD